MLVQLENLRTHPSVAVGLSASEIKLHGWVYKIETGEVFGFDPEQHQFVPIEASIEDSPGFESGDFPPSRQGREAAFIGP